MITPNLPATFIFASVTGLISAYLAIRQGRRPVIWFFVGFFFGMLGTLTMFFAPKSKLRQNELPAQTIQPYLFGPIDKFWYYADEKNTLIGPISHDAITAVWKSGKINGDTFTWHEELTDWKKLRELIRE